MIDERSRKILILTASVILLLILGLILLVISQKKSSTTSSGGSDQYDSYSHQTISNPPSKAPEKYGYGANNATPVYYGVSDLINQGMSQQQLAEMETALNAFCQQRHLTSPDISVNVDSIARKKDDSSSSGTVWIVSFGLKIANTVYNTTLREPDTETLSLTLQNPTTNAVVYSSGIVN